MVKILQLKLPAKLYFDENYEISSGSEIIISDYQLNIEKSSHEVYLPREFQIENNFDLLDRIRYAIIHELLHAKQIEEGFPLYDDNKLNINWIVYNSLIHLDLKRRIHQYHSKIDIEKEMIVAIDYATENRKFDHFQTETARLKVMEWILLSCGKLAFLDSIKVRFHIKNKLKNYLISNNLLAEFDFNDLFSKIIEYFHNVGTFEFYQQIETYEEFVYNTFKLNKNGPSDLLAHLYHIEID